MILEAYIWAFSKAVPGARKAGLVYELAGIAGRHRRHRKAWETHLNNCRALIASEVGKIPDEAPVLVLGAGLGLDVPISTLAARSGPAHMCDVVETPAMRKIIRQNHNLSFIHKDLTGLITPFWLDDTCDTIHPPTCAPLPEGEYGLVISCNILSQLPLPFVNSPAETDMDRRLTAAIQQAHMTALQRYDCPVLLITDYERRDKVGDQTAMIPTVGAPLLPDAPHQKWQWPIAPLGELAKDREVTLDVGAWLLNT